MGSYENEKEYINLNQFLSTVPAHENELVTMEKMVLLKM